MPLWKGQCRRQTQRSFPFSKLCGFISSTTTDTEWKEGEGWRLSVTQTTDAAQELIRDSYRHTDTHMQIHHFSHTYTPQSCMRMYTKAHVHKHQHTRSCSFTHDLNFNCQGRSVLNWACKRLGFFPCLCVCVYLHVCLCICVLVKWGVVGVKAVIQSELKALAHQPNCKTGTDVHKQTDSRD